MSILANFPLQGYYMELFVLIVWDQAIYDLFLNLKNFYNLGD
jgi:hypothetical protein